MIKLKINNKLSDQLSSEKYYELNKAIIQSSY